MGLVLIVLLVVHVSDTDPHDADRVVICLKWMHQAQFAGMYLAVDNGHFASRNLNAQFDWAPPASPAVERVMSGAAHYGLAGADQILLARAEGRDLVAVAAILRHIPMAFFSRATAGISHPQQFKGRAVGVKPGTNQLVYELVLHACKVSRDGIEEHRIFSDPSLFLNGELDVLPGWTINERLLLDRKGIEVSEIRAAEYGVDFYCDVLFTTSERARTRPDEVRRVVAAIRSGWLDALSTPDVAVQATMRRATQSSEEHEREFLRRVLPLIFPPGADPPSKWGRMYESDWERAAQLLRSVRTPSTPIRVQGAYTNEFLD